ncbi:MAG TPA: MEDS domain-containing protein [Bacteriovoracaceae bacterium]|nr:MEDS domain-containing protein [Bacteriovoracaceae bacterium]
MSETFQHLHSNGICGHRVATHDHLVKFYCDLRNLTDLVCDYVVPGISRGDGIIIIATQTNRKAFEAALENRSIDVTMAKAAGQVLLLDAEETLRKIMSGGMPVTSKFNAVIGEKIIKMLEKYPNIRAYGEMVNVLWKQDCVEGTIALEKFWNSLAVIHPFALLCSYSMDENLMKKGKSLSDICSTHTHYINDKGDFYKKKLLPESFL